MLNSFRAATRSWLVRGFFLILALSFGLFWGIQDIAQEIMGNKALVKVGPDTLYMEDFQKYVRWETQQAAFLSGRELPEKQVKNPRFIRMMFIQMMRNKLVELEADRMGFVIPDDHIRSIVHQSPLFAKRRSFDHGRFMAWLKSQGMSEKLFIDRIRLDLQRSHFLYALLTPMLRTPQAYMDLYAQVLGEQRSASCAALPYTTQKVSAPADEELQKHIAQHAQKFVLPELRSGFVVILENASRQEELQTQLEQALDQGTDMKELQAQFPQALFTAVTHVDAQGKLYEGATSVKESGLEPKVREALFEGDVGQASSPLSLSKDRIAFVRVETIHDQRPLTFAEARPQALADWTAAAQKKKMGETLETLAKNPQTFAATLKSLGQDPKMVQFKRPEGVILELFKESASLKDFQDSAEAVFKTDTIQQVALQLGKEQAYACQVTQWAGAHPLAPETQQVLQKWIEEQQLQDLLEAYLNHLMHIYPIKLYAQGEALLSGKKPQ